LLYFSNLARVLFRKTRIIHRCKPHSYAVAIGIAEHFATWKISACRWLV
jgi:hypothetical protein